MFAVTARASRPIQRFGRLALSILLTFAFLHLASSSANACSNSGQAANGYAYSSQLTSTAIVVCNSTATAQVSSTPATSVKSTVTCSSVLQKIWTGPPSYAVKQVRITTCGTTVTAKNITPAPPAVSSTTSSPSKTTAKVTSSADQAGFSPDPISLNADRQLAAPDQTVVFTAATAVHYKVGSILGQAVTVRFTPTAVVWDSGDGPSGESSFETGFEMRRGFSNTGSQSVSVLVKFVAAYRFAGQTGWTSETGYIAKSANVTVVVDRVRVAPATSAQPLTPKPRRIRLVSADCKARVTAPGCLPP